MRLAQLDIASRNPQAMALYYSRLLKGEFRALGGGCFAVALDRVRMLFCPRSSAGLSDTDAGVHQVCFQASGNIGDAENRAASLGSKYERLSHGELDQLCVWDPEGNPIVLRFSS